MTDKKKAKELASLLVGEGQNQEPLVEILMKMAQWKQQQMMMKNSIDAKVCRIGNTYLKEIDKDAIAKALTEYKDGDKVKLIIIKED